MLLSKRFASKTDTTCTVPLLFVCFYYYYYSQHLIIKIPTVDCSKRLLVVDFLFLSSYVVFLVFNFVFKRIIRNL